jgi:thymidylate synthase
MEQKVKKVARKQTRNIDRKGYYRKRYVLLGKLEDMTLKFKALRILLKEFMDSPEGISYKKRIAKEKRKLWEEKNKEKIKEYAKEYRKSYNLL